MKGVALAAVLSALAARLGDLAGTHSGFGLQETQTPFLMSQDGAEIPKVVPVGSVTERRGVNLTIAIPEFVRLYSHHRVCYEASTLTLTRSKLTGTHMEMRTRHSVWSQVRRDIPNGPDTL